jgi:hypothetical protein
MQVNKDGFGDSNNFLEIFDNATTIFKNNLYIGATNWAQGVEVWMMLKEFFYLPLVKQ